MAVLPTLLVNGDANMATWIGTYTDIDELITAANDADYVRSPIGPDVASFFIQDTPVDFETMTTLNVGIRYSQFGRVDDTMGLFCQMYAADATTPLSDEVTINADIIDTGWVNDTINLTGLVAGDKTTWDGARLRFRTSYTQNMAKDSTFEVRVSAVQLDGTYVVATAVLSRYAGITLGENWPTAGPISAGATDS